MIQGRGQAKEYKQPLEAEKVRTCFLPLNLQKEQKAADILSLKIFIYLFLALLGLDYFSGTFPRCRERGLLSRCSAQFSHSGSFSCCEALALGMWTSVVVAHGLHCLVACGIFPDQGSNWCPLHWQAES